MSALAVRTRAVPERHPLWLLGGATLAWFALYHWLLPFWDWLLYDVFALPQGPRWSDALHFFLYDTTKIPVLLAGIIFVARLLRSFLSIERTRSLLGGKREGLGNIAAAGLGVATPFCSLQRGPGLHWLRRRRSAARDHAHLPDRKPNGERGRRRPALRDVRLQDRRPLHRLWAADRDHRRRHPRPSAPRALHRAIRARSRREGRHDRMVEAKPTWQERFELALGRGEDDRRQGLALPACRDCARRGHPRLDADRFLLARMRPRRTRSPSRSPF